MGLSDAILARLEPRQIRRVGRTRTDGAAKKRDRRLTGAMLSRTGAMREASGAF